MLKRVLIPVLIVLGALFFITSCELEEERVLEGSWILACTPTSGTDPGSGSFSLSFQDETVFIFTIESYTGSGTLGGFAWVVVAILLKEADAVTMNVYEPTVIDPNTDYIEFTGTYSGGSVTGSYVGAGIYAGHDGDFVMY